MAEELREQAGGVPQTGEATAPTGVAIQGTAAAPAPATAAPREDLTTREDFRKWQSERDRREAQLRREAVEARQAAEQAHGRLREQEALAARSRLQGADPEEIVKFYEERERKFAADYAEMQRQQQEAATIQQEGLEYLGSVGLSPETPGLVWSERPSPDGLKNLIASAGRLLALRAQALEKSTVVRTQEAAQTARAEAVQEVGAAQVSTATGGTSPGLQEEFNRRRKELTHTGRVAEYAALKREFRDKGLDI